MGFEAAETTHKINDAFGPGTANEHPMQCGSGSFAKETQLFQKTNLWGNSKHLKSTSFSRNKTTI